MAVPPPQPVAVEPASAPWAPAVMACRNTQSITNLVGQLNMLAWFDEGQLTNQFGRWIAGVGLRIAIASPAPGFYPDGWGVESLRQLVFNFSTVEIEIGSTVLARLPASSFLDTQRLQRIFEVPIKPPYPKNNDALRFRLRSAPMPVSFGLTVYDVQAVFKAYLPPNGTEPAYVLPPRGLRPVPSM